MARRAPPRSRRCAPPARDARRCRARARRDGGGRPGGAMRGTVLARMARPATIEADVAVVGAGAAGLYAALTAADAGGRVALVSATPLAQSASYWAQGGARRRARARRHAASCTSRTRCAPAAAPCRRSAAEILTSEAPARRARPRTARRALRRRPPRPPRARAGGRALGAARSCTPAAPRPAGASRASCRRSSPSTSGSTCWRTAARSRCSTLDGRCAGVRLHDGRLVVGARASCWRPAARPRCGRARPTRPAPIGAGHGARARAPARRSPTSR